MKPKPRLGALLFLAGLAIALAGAAKAEECAPLPDVAWWKNVTHEKMVEFVEKRYGGEWAPYVEKWAAQLEKLREVHDRDGAVVTKDKIRVEGEPLRQYIEKVEQRLAITRCLASKTVSTARAGEPEAGKAWVSAAECGNCHGAAGVSQHPMIPNLAGQKEGYLKIQLWQLREIPLAQKSGDKVIAARHDRIMKPLAAEMSTADIENAAAYFASRSCALPEVEATPPAPAKAQQCAACHGQNGMGKHPGIPNLAGQKEGYLIKQLKAFRKTSREEELIDHEESRYHRIMARQTANLAEGEITALAAYFSALRCR